MIELIKTDSETGSQTWLIRHTDDDGKDIHNPQRYTVAPGTPESEVQAFADQVLANHEAGRPLTYREPTAGEILAEAKSRKRSQIEREGQRRVDAIAPPKRRERLQVAGIKIAHERGKGRTPDPQREAELVALADAVIAIDEAEQAALALIDGAGSVEDVEAINPAWPA